MKTVYILRAVPGSGKSLLAETMMRMAEAIGHACVTCCADDYFMNDGKYVWDGDKIGLAHMRCKEKYLNAVGKNIDTIIVSNTNTTAKDVKHYRNIAIEHGYMVFVMTLENWHDGKDEHNVPDDVKLAMADSLKNSLRLFKMPVVLLNGKEVDEYKLNVKTNKYDRLNLETGKYEEKIIPEKDEHK